MDKKQSVGVKGLKEENIITKAHLSITFIGIMNFLSAKASLII
jgi:hypothetical protein